MSVAGVRVVEFGPKCLVQCHARRGVRTQELDTDRVELGLIFSSDAFILPRDASSAKCGIAIVSRPSVRPSVCLSVRRVTVSM